MLTNTVERKTGIKVHIATQYWPDDVDVPDAKGDIIVTLKNVEVIVLKTSI